ncbi:MAG: bifunctional folylpolyglutamate synthase/dihydrofolate synthase [Prevotellaceae bacterium]|jgi:dihydrofolate synthase/folylpolyglutamate synthase|nr:bifunctional folylpolyglutamate synthase/dihydrofolate synthase [Prevotellaceae bacterium]
MHYAETLEYLYLQTPAFHQVGGVAYKPGLENTAGLMTALGNPHTKFKSIHIAGTNGKGSVSHYLSACLQSADYKTGLYTSPHLVDFGERIKIDGQMIDEQYVIDFVEKNKEIIEQIKPSFFEITMAMAFCYFADNKVDIAVVEVGLGGRLDSTNIITPILSIITNVALEHTEWLGNTLPQIAEEKAGIIKKNVPVVIGEACAQTRPVFTEKAETENAQIFFAEDRYSVEQNGYLPNGKMTVQVNALKYGDFNYQCFSGLTGIYQLKNIATVLTAIDILNNLTDFNIYVHNMYEGLPNVVELSGLQGRWQTVQQKPKIIVDVAHNAAGFAYVVQQLKNEQFNNLKIILGMMADKDIAAVLELLPQNATYYFTQAKTQRAIDAEKLRELSENYGLKGQAFAQIEDALQAAKNEATENDLIYIGGSNLVVGEALKTFNN